jgi:predicted CXXCH cytochrome family protein
MRMRLAALVAAISWIPGSAMCDVAQLSGNRGLAAPVAAASSGYVGSNACRPCHLAIYERWKRSRMANVVRDPKLHPEAIIPDLAKPNPLVTFAVADIAFVYGSRWKQRYFTRVGDDYFPLPAQWDVTHAMWKPYSVASGTDWWVPFYPAENLKRPTGPLCDGCHSVGYDVRTKSVSEWNVGCEKCHGPGRAHARQPTRANIIDPANLDSVAGNDVCIQCHSQGRPITNPIAGRVYDWPVGFRVGLALKDFWRLEDHRLGDTTFTHYADGSAHKNRMQGNDFVQSVMYSHSVTCADCHDAHGSEYDGSLAMPAKELCLQCHKPGGKNGPRAPTLERHTHHAAGSAGSACIACHMPKIAQTIGDVMVHSHTFRFLSPSLTESAQVPNPCTTCHKDKSNVWAKAALRSWTDASPWRVAP